MKPGRVVTVASSTEDEALRALDRYLADNAAEVFSEIADVTVGRGGLRRERPVAAVVGIAVVLFCGLVLPFGERLEGPYWGLRGGDAAMMALETARRSDMGLAVTWSTVDSATHYVVQVRDVRGTMLASRLIAGRDGRASIEIENPGSAFVWSVSAWSGTKLIASNESYSIESE